MLVLVKVLVIFLSLGQIWCILVWSNSHIKYTGRKPIQLVLQTFHKGDNWRIWIRLSILIRMEDSAFSVLKLDWKPWFDLSHRWQARSNSWVLFINYWSYWCRWCFLFKSFDVDFGFTISTSPAPTPKFLFCCCTFAVDRDKYMSLHSLYLVLCLTW